MALIQVHRHVNVPHWQFIARSWIVLSAGLLSWSAAFAQPIDNRKYGQEDKFRQLEEILPTPNGYRNAAGEPGPAYWQQRVDYDIDVTLDDDARTIAGREKITYHNQSPSTLRYLWLQIDANIFAANSDANLSRGLLLAPEMSLGAFRSLLAREAFDGSATISEVRDAAGKQLRYTIVKTMMRVDLPAPLPPGESFRFSLAWKYRINDSKIARGRTGFEFFDKDGNCIYEIAQWFPRLAAYTDATGWQNKQYLGQGEFTLELGDYLVRITVPDDHVVGATGVLQNPNEVLSQDQRQRLRDAQTSGRPLFIVTPEEARENEKSKSEGSKTWIFHAHNVRDFAFATSRKFIWDAQGHAVDGNQCMAMSYYPNEAEPLWSQFSTRAIIHTLNVYSRYTFAYPYPIAISVNGPVYGMEYPMICFNGPRPESDGTYSSRTKYSLISVIIHEVGHNYFPMIVNTDERQWTWMDEGINTFLQYLAEQEWEKDYPSQRGEPANIVQYMLSSDQVPIMTNSESVLQFGNNAYAKPATALNILRETVLGRELFDYAFKEYARRWQFKRPMPADFFRTMEDASGIDLDWFWRGWFYSTDHCDIAIDSVTWQIPDRGDPDESARRAKEQSNGKTPSLSDQRNADLPKLVDLIPDLKDFYNSYDPQQVTAEQRSAYERFLKDLKPEERQLLESKKNFYVVRLKNLGGLVMPVILRLHFQDGSEQTLRLPAEIWKQDATRVSKGLISEKILTSVELDPHRETADVNRANNFFPPRLEPSRFKLFKRAEGSASNPMQRENDRKSKKAEAPAAKPNEDSVPNDKAPAQEQKRKPAGRQPVTISG